MRGTALSMVPQRIRGRASLLRRLRALLLAAHRFGRHRASTAGDRQFAIGLIDGLTATLATIDPAPETRNPMRREKTGENAAVCEPACVRALGDRRGDPMEAAGPHGRTTR